MIHPPPSPPSPLMATENDVVSGFAGWTQLYQQSLQDPIPNTHFGVVSDSTLVTTTPSPIGSASPGHMEGRVGKSIRKRSRASRRAPTTLLNTDTANFRAMVQQFTGIASATGGGPFTNLAGIGANGPLRQPMPVPSYQFQQQQLQQLRQQYRSLEQEFTLGSNNDIRGSNEAADVGLLWEDVAGHVMMPAQQPSADSEYLA